jgi:WD40 repeat protein
VIEAHTDSVLFVRGDDEHIVSCSKDRTIRLFSTTTLEQLLLIPVLAEACNAVSLTRDFLVSASGDKTLRVWDIRDGRLLTKIEAHLRGVSALAFEEATPAAPARWRPEFPGAVLRGTVVTGSSDNGVRMFHIVQVPPGTPQSDLSFRDMLDLEHLAIDADGDADDDLGDRPHLIIRPAIDYEAPCTCDLRIGCKCWHKELVRSVFIGEQTVLSGSYDMTIKVSFSRLLHS